MTDKTQTKTVKAEPKTKLEDEPETVTEAETKDEPVEAPVFGGGLRELLQQRVENKDRRLHRHWFCFNPALIEERDRVLAEFSTHAGNDFIKQTSAPKSRKYAASAKVESLGDRLDELTEQLRAAGAYGVFKNLTDAQLNEMAELDAKTAQERGFIRLRWVLLESFQGWETADHEPIPADVLGRDDLELLLQPEVVEQGEIVPLGMAIVDTSREPFDLPTLPQP